MIAATTQSWLLTQRLLRALARQPWLVAVSLVQPLVWLLLFGALFASVVEIPGFGSDSYPTFLLPGIVVMSALFAGGWSGVGMVEDIDRGILNRQLVSPVRRGAVTVGRAGYQVVTTVLQALLLVGVGWLVGADLDGGPAGVAVLLTAAVLLSLAFAAISNGLALVTRNAETLIVLANFVAMPMTFLSSVMMRHDLAEPWVRHVADVNPANWAVVAGREAMSAAPDWMSVWSHMGYLLAFTIGCALLGTRAFGRYQRTA